MVAVFTQKEIVEEGARLSDNWNSMPSKMDTTRSMPYSRFLAPCLSIKKLFKKTSMSKKNDFIDDERFYAINFNFYE